MGRIIGRGIEALIKFIKKCRDAGGVPIIRTKYGGVRLPHNSVVVACWGRGDVVKGGTITDIPPDLIDELEKTKGDWKWLLERYGGGVY